MVALSSSPPAGPLHPLHAILLAFPVSMFFGTLLSDLACRGTFEIQWANFSQWLNAGGLLGGGLALLWALVNLVRSRAARAAVVYVIALGAMWVVGFTNALVHAKDAWAMMPEAIWLSAISAVLALVAAWVGYSGAHGGGLR